MYTTEQILEKKKLLNKEISNLQDELISLRDSCNHHNLRYKYDGTDSGWDYDASYWVDWFCPDCEKRWTTAQAYDLIKKTQKEYPNAKEISRYKNLEKFKSFWSPNT